jgi:hypothetical protein
VTRNLQVPKINNQGLPLMMEEPRDKAKGVTVADAEPVPSCEEEIIGNRGHHGESGPTEEQRSAAELKVIRTYGSNKF